MVILTAGFIIGGCNLGHRLPRKLSPVVHPQHAETGADGPEAVRLPGASALAVDIQNSLFQNIPLFSCLSEMPPVKLIQPLCQCLGIFLVYHMAGVPDDLQLRPRDVLGQKAGRF